MEEDYIIMSSQKDKSIATTIADKLDMDFGDILIKTVNDNENCIAIEDYVMNKKIFLIYNISQPINSSIIQLMLVVDKLKKLGADKVYLITNYLPYTKIKYETKFKLNFNLFARLLEECGLDTIYTFDLYAPRISLAFKIPIYNVSISTIFYELLNKKFTNKNIILTSIDYELQKKTRRLAKIINSKTVFPTLNEKDNKTKFSIDKAVNNKDVLIIGDMINTGSEVISYANYLTYKGANNIYIISTHGILNKSALSLIEKSLIKEIYVICNHLEKSKKIKVVSISSIIMEIIKRVVEKKNLYKLLK